jgi:hypothetical protein
MPKLLPRPERHLTQPQPSAPQVKDHCERMEAAQRNFISQLGGGTSQNAETSQDGSAHKDHPDGDQSLV